MINIRKYLFETNSSSVHTITMCNEDEYNDWVNGSKWFLDEKFYNKDELLIFMKKQKLFDYEFKCNWKNKTFTYKGKQYSTKEMNTIADQYYNDISDDDAKSLYEKYLNDVPFEIPLSYKDYTELIDYETYESKFTSKSGDTVVAFGYYGRDG